MNTSELFHEIYSVYSNLLTAIKKSLIRVLRFFSFEEDYLDIFFNVKKIKHIFMKSYENGVQKQTKQNKTKNKKPSPTTQQTETSRPVAG